MTTGPHPHAQLIEQFYLAFQRRDPAGMVACYADDIWFSDPVFHDLRGPRRSRNTGSENQMSGA